MSRWLIARSGPLAGWRLPTAASYNTTFCPKPSLKISSAFHTSPPKLAKLSWLEWIKEHPTTAEEMQTVYDACVESRVFARRTERAVVYESGVPVGVTKTIRNRDLDSLDTMFKQIEGLKPEDWEARGIKFSHAVAITRRLKKSSLFAEEKGFKKFLTMLPQIQVRAQAQAEGKEVPGHKESSGSDQGSASFQNSTTSEQAQGTQAVPAGRSPKEAETAGSVESKQADKARQTLKQRKKMERMSDAEEGIKSKRRPLRLASTSNGVPLNFGTAETLRRVERGGREIVVDKEIKNQTKGKGVKWAKPKKGKPKNGKPKNGNTSKNGKPKNGKPQSKPSTINKALHKGE